MLKASEVREIAAEWHGGQASPLYALCSSGAIVAGVEREIRDDIACLVPGTHAKWSADDIATEVPRLEALLAYVTGNGERGPVSGWSGVRF